MAAVPSLKPNFMPVASSAPVAGGRLSQWSRVIRHITAGRERWAGAVNEIAECFHGHFTHWLYLKCCTFE
jgi:hypothetical protein